MSSMMPNDARQEYQQWGDARGGYAPPTGFRGSGGPPWGLILTGIAVVGLGMMAWQYLGPDLRRYIKISNM